VSSYSSKFVHSIGPAEKPNSLKNLYVMALGDLDIAKNVMTNNNATKKVDEIKRSNPESCPIPQVT
jgi:hypothetical protein